jgi:thiol-disulfide isomerase/thioredoxin
MSDSSTPMVVVPSFSSSLQPPLPLPEMQQSLNLDSCAINNTLPPAPPSKPKSSSKLRGVLSFLESTTIALPGGVEAGSMEVEDYILEKPYLLLYFSAEWCPPCRRFSPLLSDFALKNADDLNVLFCSHDSSEQSMQSFAKGKHFGVLPFQHPSLQTLNQVLGITMLPSVIVIDSKTGKTITTWGRACVQYNGQQCVEGWKRGEQGVNWVKTLCTIS